MWSSRPQDKAPRAERSACFHHPVMRYPASKRVRSNTALELTAKTPSVLAAAHRQRSALSEQLERR